MDPVQSWLDANEVRRMAESLMAPPAKVDVSTIDAGYGENFEGFADASHAETSDVAAIPVSAHQSDGRPHAQRQPIQRATQHAFPSDLESEDLAMSPADVSPMANMGNTLADARRVAEGSGMLQGSDKGPDRAPDRILLQTEPIQDVWSQPIEPQIPTPPVAPMFSPEVHTEPSGSIAPTHKSPFQVSADQSHTSKVPVARQVRPAEEVQPSVPSPAPTPPQAPPAPDPVVFEKSPFDLPEETLNEPEVDVARGPFLTRLQRFSAILRRDLNARSMFLIDNEGQVLLDEVENPKLIQVARTLANASYRAHRQSSGSAAVGNLHVKIGASATLEVIPVQSRYGLLILGVIFPSPIGAERVGQVADLLYTTVEPTLK